MGLRWRDDMAELLKVVVRVGADVTSAMGGERVLKPSKALIHEAHVFTASALPYQI
jgi:hypothetical protein